MVSRAVKVTLSGWVRTIKVWYFPRRFWSQSSSYSANWEDRAVLAAGMIPAGSSVLDVGCGRMQLKDHLPPGCSYMPADLTKWAEDTVQVDLSKGEFPAGQFDYATILGVLEYLPNPEVTLGNARVGCTNLVVSYCHPNDGRFGAAKNAFSRNEFEDLLSASGWEIVRNDSVDVTKNYSQRLYVARGRAY